MAPGDSDGEVGSDRTRERYSHAPSGRERAISPSGSRSDLSRRHEKDRSRTSRSHRSSRRDGSYSASRGSSRRQPRSMSPSRSRSPPPSKRRHRSPSVSRSPPRRRQTYDDESRLTRPPKRRRDGSYTSPSPPARRHRGRSRDRSPAPRASYDGSKNPPPPRRHARSRSRSPNRDDRRPRRDSRGAIRRHPDAPRSRSPSPVRRRGPLKDQAAAFRHEIDIRRGRPTPADDEVPVEKQKPNYNPTGLLAKESNRVEGTKVILKYHEPPEARKPPSSKPWRLYVFKGAETLQTIHLYTRSCWLIGREAAVADIRVDHPSASGQHAAIQFRNVKKKVPGEFPGEEVKKDVVRPYIIDLESSNGTFLNGERLDKARYVEVRDGDVVKVGGSEREYVFMLPPKEDK